MSAPQEEVNSVCIYGLIDFISQPTVAREGNLLLTERHGANQ